MAVTRRNLQAAKDQFEVGSTDRQEVLRWETQLFANEQEVNSQRASLLINMGNLNQILNLPIETRGDLEPLTIAKDGFIFSSAIVTEMVSDPEKTRIIRDYLVELGLANSPLLAGFQFEIEAQSTQIKSDNRWAVPNLSFNASAGTKWLQEGEGSDSSSTNNTGTWQVGMSLDWPIVSGNANVARVKQAKSQLSSLDYQRTDIKTTLDLSIRSSAAVVISDYINMGFANAQAEAARENYDLVYDSYMVGESTLLDFIDAQQQKLDADISATLALYTFFADLIATELEISFFPFLQQPDQVAAIIAELENRLLIN